jgi:hypothetical protein
MTKSAPGRRARDADDERPLAPGQTLRIPLEHMRYRHLAWMSFGLVTGLLLIVKLGTVGQWLGVVLIGVGAYAGYSFARTILFPPGTIVVSTAAVELPRGLCKGPESRFEPAQISHVYLLRRAVPWTRAAPVLVIEADGKAYTYPRDWFLTEADQRRIVRELHARGAGRKPAAADAAADDSPDDSPDDAADAAESR